MVQEGQTIAEAKSLIIRQSTQAEVLTLNSFDFGKHVNILHM